MDILTITPTKREARALRRDVLVTGSGDPAAAMLNARLQDGKKPDLVLIAGYCGGLDPSLGSGSIILGRSTIAPKQDEIKPRDLLLDTFQKEFRHRKLRFVTSRLLTMDRPAATKWDKTRLWNVFGSGGVDMETYQLAAVADGFGVDWIAVRVVIDSAGSTLPRTLRAWRQEEDQGAILRSAVFHPGEWAAYARLARSAGGADRALRVAVAAATKAAEKAPVEELPLLIS